MVVSGNQHFSTQLLNQNRTCKLCAGLCCKRPIEGQHHQVIDPVVCQPLAFLLQFGQEHQPLAPPQRNARMRFKRNDDNCSTDAIGLLTGGLQKCLVATVHPIE